MAFAFGSVFSDRFGKSTTTGDISLNAVLESGYKIVGAAARIFEEAKAETNKLGINLLGASSFATKDCDELMLPDFVYGASF